MIVLAPGTKVYLACRPVSMQKGFDGLTALAQQVLDAEPYSGHLFVFRGKRGQYFKALYRDASGMCLFAKRLEKGRFVGRRWSTAASCSAPRSWRYSSRASTGGAPWHPLP